MHKPRKRFGQHFLQDSYVIQQLVDTIAPTPAQRIIEIGPGQGALTIPTLQRCHHLEVIELDYDLIPLLEERCQPHGNLTIHETDALDFDFSLLISEKQSSTPSLRIIGNLPYNISTPLIFHLLEYAKYICDMHFMLQKEVVDRLAAKPGTADYGRLSIMVQYHCEVNALFDIPPEAFFPPPKVNSRIVKLAPFQTLPHKANNHPLFARIVKEAFNHRRKTLRNCLKSHVNQETWDAANIDSQLRPEQLSVADYVRLSNLMTD